MPYDSRVREAIERIAAEHGLSLAEARRYLHEQIDFIKRARLSQASVPFGKNANPGDVRLVKVDPANPQRKHVRTDLVKTKLKGTPAQLAALEQQRQVRSAAKRERLERERQERHSNTASRERVKSGNVSREKRLVTPQPGSMSGIIVGVLRDSQDFHSAFLHLRAQTRFEHLSDAELKQRMREVAWRYDLPLEKRGYANTGGTR